ncbi:MAG: prolipoprotein diacylglyceryl transferase family protein [Bacteroidota bacterium]
MIPFADVPPLQLGPLTIQVFGLTVAVAVLVGLAMARRRFARFGLEPAAGEQMAMWLLVGGFLGAHLFAVLFYFPGEVARDPWLLLRVWEHISSFGGMIGGFLGAALYLWLRAPNLRQQWAYLDVAGFVFPFSLALGRVGCALVHDHPGRITDFPLAVSLESEAAQNLIAYAYASSGQAAALPPPSVLPSLGFHDLGLYEVVYLAAVVLPVLVVLDRKPRPTGFFLRAFAALYMPVRFGLDFLRVSDATYAGLTPAQWVAAAVLVSVPFLWRRIRRGVPVGRDAVALERS